MDPEATHAMMNDESNDLDERAVAATDLLCHMAASGSMFVHAGDRSQSTWRVADECRYRVFAALDRLAKLETFVAGIAALAKDGEGDDAIENDDIYDHPDGPHRWGSRTGGTTVIAHDDEYDLTCRCETGGCMAECVCCCHDEEEDRVLPLVTPNRAGASSAPSTPNPP